MKKIRVVGLFMTCLLVGVLGYAQIAADAVKGSGTATVGQGTSASNQQAPGLKPGWPTVFPDGLLDGRRNPATVEVLKNKFVGLYFSAHWCPPCRAFSPKLVEFRDAHTKDFEVVFISSDKDENAQFAYMKELNMKWYTVKYRSEVAKSISQKYGVKSIPTLVILSPNGDLITDQGRNDVTDSSGSCISDWKTFSGVQHK